jgi:hypothetical protein
MLSHPDIDPLTVKGKDVSFLRSQTGPFSTKCTKSNFVNYSSQVCFVDGTRTQGESKGNRHSYLVIRTSSFVPRHSYLVIRNFFLP